MTSNSIQSEFRTELGRRLLKYRRNEGISQTTLGQEVGCHRNTIMRWEQGQDSLDLWMLLRVCDVLHVNVMAMLPPTDLTWGRDLDPMQRERNRGLLKSVEMERDPVLTAQELGCLPAKRKQASVAAL